MAVNQKRREKLREVVALLNRTQDTVENICDQEQDAMDNTPESLQESGQYSAMEAAVDDLGSAAESINDAKNRIKAAIQG